MRELTCVCVIQYGSIENAVTFWTFLGCKKALAVGLRLVGPTPFVTRYILLNIACNGRVLCRVCLPGPVLRREIYTDGRSSGTHEFGMDEATLTLPGFSSLTFAPLSCTAAAADFTRCALGRSSYRVLSGINTS